MFADALTINFLNNTLTQM